MSNLIDNTNTGLTKSAPRYIVDWPTISIAVLVYGSFLLLTWHYHQLPWWVVWPLGATIVGLHGSLQHEGTHNYPTRWQGVNSWIVGWSLWLWLPYLVYRRLHRTHHIDERLTDPRLDPESNYLTPEILAQMSPVHLAIRRAMASLGGRMLIGPAYFAFATWREAIHGIRLGDRDTIRAWFWHILSCVAILYWVLAVCEIPLWAYILFFAYPGTSLALVRSFAEHRAAETIRHRTVICEAGWYWSFLFLNNNLHLAHHNAPGEAWHQRPAIYRRNKEQLLEENGGYLIKGYGVLFAKYFFHAKEPLLHPYPDAISSSAVGAQAGTFAQY